MKKTSIQKVSINEAKRFFSLYFNLPIEEFNAKKQPGGGYISTHTAVLDNKYGTILTYSKINNIVRVKSRINLFLNYLHHYCGLSNPP